MQGVVRAININKGWIAVETENHTYSLIELFGDDVETGDVLKGNLETLGSEDIFNTTQDENMDVIIQHVLCDARHAHQLL